MLVAQTRENAKNAEQHEWSDKKPNLLKRVGRSLQRIVEAPLHVVGGVLEATNHALHGRLDRSARSIAGWFKASFGSLHEGIRTMPLIGDVVKKVEWSASWIREKVWFIGEDDSDIKDAEERMRKALEWILIKRYNWISDAELEVKTEELRKQVVDEISEKKKEEKKEMNETNYDTIKSAIPHAPINFTDLSSEQKEALQIMYFNRDEKPDLHIKDVSQFFEKLLVSTKTNATQQEKDDLNLFALENHESLIKNLKISQLENTASDYYLHKAEIRRRRQVNPSSKIWNTLGWDWFVGNSD